MTDHLAFGKRVKFYRERRKLPQWQLGALLGRSEDWVYRVEAGRIPVNNVKMLMDLADALRVHLEDLQGTPMLLEDHGNHKASVPAIRAALMQSRRLSGSLFDDREPPRLERMAAEVDRAWGLYQSSEYAQLGAALPSLLADARLATHTYESGIERAQAFRWFALAQHVSAVYLRKLGETNLAWNAIDQGDIAASEADDPAVILAVRRGVAHVQLGAGLTEEAVRVTVDAASDLAPEWWKSSAVALSVYGTLHLNGAIAAARMRDRSLAQEVTKEMLEKAGRAAKELGADGNEMWTSFGPGNVQIHRLATALEFDDVDVDAVVKLAARVKKLTGLPIERRARMRLDVARAYGEADQTDDAVENLKRAYRTAPEQIRAHEFARDLAGRLHKRTRRRDVQELAVALGAIK